jgi:hypothetical protein
VGRTRHERLVDPRVQDRPGAFERDLARGSAPGSGEPAVELRVLLENVGRGFREAGTRPGEPLLHAGAKELFRRDARRRRVYLTNRVVRRFVEYFGNVSLEDEGSASVGQPLLSIHMGVATPVIMAGLAEEMRREAGRKRRQHRRSRAS